MGRYIRWCSLTTYHFYFLGGVESLPKPTKWIIFTATIIEWLFWFNEIWNMPVHDGVVKWKHFPRYWPVGRRIHRSPVNSPQKGQWRGALAFSMICAWTNGWVNNQGAMFETPSRHYDVTSLGYNCSSEEIWFARICTYCPYLTETHNFRTIYGHGMDPWWRHQMDTFSALLALCAGKSPATGEFLSQRPVRRSFEVFSDLPE